MQNRNTRIRIKRGRNRRNIETIMTENFPKLMSDINL